MSADRAEPVWVTESTVAAIHARQIREHGGSLGVRDEGLLASALERPRNRWHSAGTSDLAALAAAYGFGIAKNHAFIDGNKRTAFQVMYVFLGINGYDVEAPEPEVVETMEAVASGRMGEAELTRWLAQRMVASPTDADDDVKEAAPNEMNEEEAEEEEEKEKD